jgi:hypothetical protein
MRGGWVHVEKQSRLFGYSSVRFMIPSAMVKPQGFSP